MALSRHDWKIVDWDIKPQHKQNFIFRSFLCINCDDLVLVVQIHSVEKLLNNFFGHDVGQPSS